MLAWDRDTRARRIRTNAAHGVTACDIEPDGEHFWWFDADPTGAGIWRRQPVWPLPTAVAEPPPARTGPAPAVAEPASPALADSTPSPLADSAPPALAGLPAGRQQGIAFDAAGRCAAACITTGAETRCYLGPPGGAGNLVAVADGHTTLVDLSPDGRTIALAGRAGTGTAISVIRLTDGRTDVVPGSDRERIWALEFRPGDRPEPELLVVAETEDGYRVGTWRADQGVELSRDLSYDSEITAHWYGDAGRVLIQHDRAGRSRLLLADLDTGEQVTVVTPPGTILDLSCDPGGAVHYVWTRESVPPRCLVADPATAVTGPPGKAGPRAATGPPATAGPPAGTGTSTATGPPAVAGRSELWTVQPYGRIHSFLATPPGPGPWPTLFLVHGGPYLHDRDAFDPRVELFVRAGYAVVRTNYRGSTGYGPNWQRAFDHRVGLAQLDDLAAVRRHLIGLDVAEPGRIGLCGYSWGGYLVLLAMGVAPADWAVGLAVAPVADYPAAYRDTTAALREVDDELFGGGPDDVPRRYHAADPMTYLDRVRGPLFIAAATEDDRCPPEQVRRYVARLRLRGVPHRLHWMPGGHHGDAAGQTRAFGELLRYASETLRPDPSGATGPEGRPEPTAGKEVNGMKRRSVRHDPIASGERERGAVIVKMLLNMDQAVPAPRQHVTEAAADKAAGE
ncbi:S9 family peptidase [Plantactinospora sp. KBS50]|nr:S9 family peptidase [Plantactinospora sp. KBS50]